MKGTAAKKRHPPSEPSQLERIATQAPIGLLALDVSGTITFARGGEGTLCGLDAEEVINGSAFEIFRDAPALVAALRRALDGERTVTSVEARSGWFEARTAPLCDANGAVDGAVCTVTDQTRAVQANEKLKRDLHFVEALIEHVPSMIFVKDAKALRFVRFNRAGEKLLGYDRRELVGKNDYDFFPKEQADFFTKNDRAVLEHGEPLEIPEETIHTCDKGARILRTTKVPIYDRSGRPLYLLGISEDVTAQKRAEDERKRLVDELRKLDALKTQLFANVSHEFRTPLALIQAYVDRLVQTAPATLDRGDLRGIERNAQRVLALVRDLLDVAKLEAAKLTVDYAEVDLAALVRESASPFEVLAAHRDITLSVQTPASLLADVNVDMVRRCIENLLSNAVRCVPRGGRVRCTLEEANDRARLFVADSGEGIRPALRDKIFERFYQVEADPVRAGGTGLGLAIVREFAELHGGSATVDTAPEGGAEFLVELPVHAPMGVPVAKVRHEAGMIAPPVGARGHAAIPVSPPAVEASRPHILVVEDNPELNLLLRETLAQSYRVTAAFDGEEGLRCAQTARPDLILTDIMMPRMSGDRLVGAIRERKELDEIPIVVLTARADDELRMQLLREGAQDYVMKPFATEELLARVQNLVAIKRTRDVLRQELASSQKGVEALVRELATRKRQLELLTEMSRTLAESLDYRQTLGVVARSALPDLADWCVVHVVEEPEHDIVRVASAHVDPQKAPLIIELTERYPPNWESSWPASLALQTGEPQLVPSVTNEALLDACGDGEQFQLLHRLGVVTAMSVPLVARERTLGAISLASSAPGRCYTWADVALVKELAHRAAMAIDNSRLYAEARAAVQLRDEFLSIASHELRTPLTSLILTLQTLERPPPGTSHDAATIAKLAAMAASQAVRLAGLVEKLLDATRIEQGPLRLDVEDLDLRALVEEVVDRFRPELMRAQCAISITGAERVVGRWDRSRLEQVVLNLLSNAAKFGRGRPIEISLRREGEKAMLSVSDRGIGIDPADQERLFARFARVASPRHYGGLGLGLYISRRIVEAHGGTIRAQSLQGAGTTFIVELPSRAPAMTGEVDEA